jgi:hypothetical protein
MKKLMFALAAVSLVASSAPSFAAAPCKDSKGKFVKCPTKPAAAKPVAAQKCRDAKGKFIKCPTAPAKPATCRDAKGKFIKCK